MDRRFSLALAVSLLFMMLFLWVFPTRRPPPKEGEVVETPDTAEPGIGGAGEEVSGDATVEPVLSEGGAAASAWDVALDDAILVDTDRYRAHLSNRGGVIVELYSRLYDQRVFSDEERATLPFEKIAYPFLLDIDPAEGVHAFALRRVQRGAGLDLEHSNWKVSRSAVEGGTDVEFVLEDGTGVRFVKTFRFRDGRDDIEFFLRMESQGEPRGRGTLDLELVSAPNVLNFFSARFTRGPSGVVGVGRGSDTELVTVEGSKLRGEAKTVGVDGERLAFYGVHSNHFANVLWPDAETAKFAVDVRLESVINEWAVEQAVAESGVPPTATELADLREKHRDNARATATLRVPKDGAELHFLFYAGPKSPPVMAEDRYAPFRQLYLADYGNWFPWINRGLLAILRGFHALLGNWGVAIILLTVLVKVVLFPMNRLQSRTMEDFQKKMAALKPKLDEIKNKYKNNLRKFQEEQQKLMREHQVRPPVFGCLILFLQFPVFMGLFQILRTSFELHQAPFFGWIDDLSRPDALPLPFDLWLPIVGSFGHLNLLPLVMMAMMVLQMRMMPKPSDPQQAQMQKTMMLMPFLFGVFLYTYASGLSLYMLTNAVLGIVQTKYFRVHTTT